MNSLLQRALLRAYAGLHGTGLFSTRVGRWAFSRAYALYKERLEVTSIDALRALVPAGATVVDIGANIGFFTRRFATWVGENGSVIALEPEPRNFADLRQALESGGVGRRVELLQAAAANFSGTTHLKLNPLHPGDHKLATDGTGIDVAVVRLDDVLAQRGWPQVALVKVDVQGAEERVLDGAMQTFTRVRPCWFVEVDDEHLRAMGGGADTLIRRFSGHGYSVHTVTAAGIGPARDVDDVIAALRPGVYQDLLFKPC